MLGDMWSSSELTAEKLGISSPLGQKKPWKPKALYNIKMCREIINKFYSEENYNIAA